MAVPLLLNAFISFGQFNVSGRVTDSETGEPLMGANVLLLGTSKATAPGPGGRFILENVSKGAYTLRITHIGFVTQEKTVEVSSDVVLGDLALAPSSYMTDEVIVNATRADENTPVTYTFVDRQAIEKQNFGQDLPFVLNFTPSLVTTSDAGAGVGYTGLRIRGSDATRINVTINGIPLNDSESQGVFWVNTPDIASSTENIQIQRGVGTSTNGAGAFGATINLQTNTRKDAAYAEVVNAVGSFNTLRHTVEFGSGLIDDKWTFDGRLSKITSDGYIDRASSDLQSYYLSGGYYGEKTLIKAIVFGGRERTYQSWYGTPEAVLERDPEGIEAVIINNSLNEQQAENMRTAGRTFNWYLYEDQVDNYQQDHYQLHLSQTLANSLTGNVALHYTYGRGYFEEFRENDSFSGYGLPNVIISNDTIQDADFVRRRWLDNHFYGFTYSLAYENTKADIVLGGGYNEYDGDHFGEIIWTEFGQNAFIEDRYYENVGRKQDFNTYIKANYQLSDRLNVFADLQYRNIGYTIEGVFDERDPSGNDIILDVDENYNFFNPKFGLTYQLDRGALYTSYAVSNREPIRSDFVDSRRPPEHETLRNLELGYRFSRASSQFSANLYYMDYKNQLVLTGGLNNVGGSLRTNVDRSYRAGIELEGAVALSPKLRWNANVALSRNKIDTYVEELNDYGVNFDQQENFVTAEFNDTDIAFSPNVIAGSQLSYILFNSFEVSLLTKYVGEQFLDNTSNDDRTIDAYFTNDLRLNYSIKTNFIKEIGLNLLVNNVFSEMYSSNGYTFGYFAGQDFEVRENYFYPQAPRNFLFSMMLRF